MAEVNGKEISPDTINEMITAAEDEDKKSRNNAGSKTGLLDLLTTGPNLRCNTLILFFNWMVNSGTYYGLSLSATDLGGNPYFNFFLSAAVEIPAYLFNLAVLNRPSFGRRVTLAGCLFLTGAALVITIFVPKEQTALLITLSMIGKLAITASYGVVYIFSAELYPTEVRNVGMGGSSMCARIGGMLCPYVNMLIDTWRPLPYIIYGAMAFAAGILALKLPETLKKKLPETLEDGEKFK